MPPKSVAPAPISTEGAQLEVEEDSPSFLPSFLWRNC